MVLKGSGGVVTRRVATAMCSSSKRGNAEMQSMALGREREAYRGISTHSSGCMGLNWTASSVYSLRHAGQRLLRFSLM